MYYLGVDLGGTNIKAALVSENGEIVKEAAAPTNLPRTAQEVCDDIAALCLQLSAGEPVAGIGVGCPGTVCDKEKVGSPQWRPKNGLQRKSHRSL